MEGSSLSDVQPPIGERRTHQMMVEDISSKLSSKDDWVKFFAQNL